MRQQAKTLAERVLLSLFGNPERMAGRSLVLAYHNVVPDLEAGRGDRSLHLPLSRFLGQLNRLEETCAIVPLAEMLASPRDQRRPRVAITFDDAYRGAVELALPELHRRGHPATLFVAPGILGAARLWWDAWAESTEGLSEEQRSTILERQAGRSEPPPCAPLPPWYGVASEEQVRALAETGTALGAHSWSHPNLAQLNPEELREEMERPLVWLGERGVAAPMIAYPYGVTSKAVERCAEELEYLAGFRVEGGWMREGESPRWSLPRFNVPAGLSENGFRLRLAGRLG